MKLTDLATAVETERAKLPSVAKAAQRKKAVEDSWKGNAKQGGPMNGKVKKDRTALKAARVADRAAKKAAKQAARQAARQTP